MVTTCPAVRGCTASARPGALWAARWLSTLPDALLTGAELLGVRLAVLATDMCPRFHVDRVLARLVVTPTVAGSATLRAIAPTRRRG